MGYVDAGPALLTARLGVRTAHYVETALLRRLFAALLLLVAARLLWEVVGA